MAIITYQSSERPNEIPNEEYGTCCGLPPRVFLFKRAEILSIECRNPECELSYPNAVAAYVNDGPKTWDKWRKEHRGEADRGSHE
jgi:hypothetical protein